MKKREKATYTTPCLTATTFDVADVLLLTQGGDDNEGGWEATMLSLKLDIFNLREDQL